MLDKDFRAARQHHAFAVLWDNHDIGDSFNGNDKDAAMPKDAEQATRAFAEWVPLRGLRNVSDGGVTAAAANATERIKIYRSISFGPLLDLILMDVLVWRKLDAVPGADAAPGHAHTSIIGNAQFAWVSSQLSSSTSAWRVIANQNLFVPFSARGVASTFAGHALGWMLVIVLLLAAACCWPSCQFLRTRTQQRDADASLPDDVTKAEEARETVGATRDEGDEGGEAARGSGIRGGEARRPAPEAARRGCCAREALPAHACACCCGLGVVAYIGICAVVLVILSGTGDAAGIMDTSAWDGYPADRRRLLAHLRDETIGNNVVLSGDVHLGILADLTGDTHEPEAGEAVGVEFAPNSVSRGNYDEGFGEFGWIASPVAALFHSCNRHWRHTQWTSHGFGVLEVTAERVIAELVYWDIRDSQSGANDGGRFEVKAGVNRWTR